jgi:hypothetical protein
MNTNQENNRNMKKIEDLVIKMAEQAAEFKIIEENLRSDKQKHIETHKETLFKEIQDKNKV